MLHEILQQKLELRQLTTRTSVHLRSKHNLSKSPCSILPVLYKPVNAAVSQIPNRSLRPAHLNALKLFQLSSLSNFLPKISPPTVFIYAGNKLFSSTTEKTLRLNCEFSVLSRAASLYQQLQFNQSADPLYCVNLQTLTSSGTALAGSSSRLSDLQAAACLHPPAVI